MSIHKVTYYQGRCDWPDCEERPSEEYTAWDTPAGVEEDMNNADWWPGPNGKNYCSTHPARWACDIADGDDVPPLPYLLIDDNGEATLKMEVADGERDTGATEEVGEGT